MPESRFSHIRTSKKWKYKNIFPAIDLSEPRKANKTQTIFAEADKLNIHDDDDRDERFKEKVTHVLNQSRGNPV